jgi:hypothetical protein
LQITELGLDLSSADKLNEFLRSEMIAMGLAEQYMSVVQELLLIPAGSEAVWNALVKGTECPDATYMYIAM